MSEVSTAGRDELLLIIAVAPQTSSQFSRRRIPRVKEQLQRVPNVPCLVERGFLSRQRQLYHVIKLLSARGAAEFPPVDDQCGSASDAKLLTQSFSFLYAVSWLISVNAGYEKLKISDPSLLSKVSPCSRSECPLLVKKHRVH